MKIVDEKQKKYSRIISDFLGTNDLISVHALEKSLNIPLSTISHTKTGRAINEKHIYPLLCELSKYGLTIDGYRMELDEDTYILLASRTEKVIETREERDSESGSFVYIVEEYRWAASDYSDLP